MRPEGLRVALVSSQPKWGGGEQWLWSLGEGLRSRGHSVSWIAPSGSDLAERVESQSQPIHKTDGRGNKASDLWSVRKFLKKHSPQVLQLNDSHAVAWSSLAALGLSRSIKVAIKHTIFPVHSVMKYRLLIDRVICVSKAAQQACITCGLKEKQTAVIYGGVQPPASNPEDKSWALEQLGWPSNTKLIVAAGNLQSCKGHRYLVEAMATLSRTSPNARLAIAGEGEERKALENIVADRILKDRVALLGFRKDAQRWLSAADVVAQPSLSEALSLVAIESQMLGKPLVATSVGGLAEVVQREGDAQPLAWIVAPESAAELATVLQSVVRGGTEVRARCERAKERALAQFHVDRMVQEVIELYCGLLDSRKIRYRVA